MYGVTIAGVCAGYKSAQAPWTRYVKAPFLAIPTLIVAYLAWVVVQGVFLSGRGEVLTVMVLVVFLFLAGWLAGVGSAYQPEPDHKRGTYLADSSTQRPLKYFIGDALTIAGQPLDPADETKHFKFVGTTGTGKSTAIRELLTAALARGDRAVIADPDGSYLERFYDPNRGDVILNPFDPRSVRWDLFAEMHTVVDADQLARSLIPDVDGPERNWRGYARVFLSSTLRQLHRVRHDDPVELYQLLSTTPIDDLRELLADTPAGAYLSEDNGKFFGAVRAVANTHLAALEHIALQANGDRFSVRAWVKRPPASTGVLFLPYQANEIATLKGLISTWLRLAIFETMTATAGQGPSDQRLWFVVDELDALGTIDGLKDALARLRKFGGRCVLGFQSIAQVSGTYGHAEAQTIVENCGNTLILRCSASENGGTARFASNLIGQREVIREHLTVNDGGGMFSRGQSSTSASQHHVTESAVLPSQIEQLPDLEGYLKIASRVEWRRVRLAVT